MILDYLFKFFANILNGLTAGLPNPSIPDFASYVNAISPLWNGLAWVNQYVPLTEAVGLISLLLVLWAAKYVFQAGIWFFTKIHVLGGSSE